MYTLLLVLTSAPKVPPITKWSPAIRNPIEHPGWAGRMRTRGLGMVDGRGRGKSEALRSFALGIPEVSNRDIRHGGKLGNFGHVSASLKLSAASQSSSQSVIRNV